MSVAGRADHQPAGAAIERLAARRLELGPELVRAHRQRHEGRALADREPGDAGQAMARALVVRRPEAVDADDLRAAGGEVVAERAADGAEADDDHVRGGDVHAGRLSTGRTTIAACNRRSPAAAWSPGPAPRRSCSPAPAPASGAVPPEVDGGAGADRAPARLDQPRQPDPRPARPGRRRSGRASRSTCRAGFADELGVGLVLLTFDAAAKSVEAVKGGQADIGFFAIDPLRSDGIRFTAPYVLIEGAYLVRQASPADRQRRGRPARHPHHGRPGQRLRPLPDARAEGGAAHARADLAEGGRRIPRRRCRRRRRREAAARGRRRPGCRACASCRAASW